MRLGFDHNVSPREDVAKYGEKMVQAGKMTREQLKRLIRYVDFGVTGVTGVTAARFGSDFPITWLGGGYLHNNKR